MNDAGAPLRFGTFELDLVSEELRKRGALVKLQAQPFKVLALLASRPGELVARDQIRRHVWGADTFVDFDQGINVCIRQIRQALGDHAESPRFVETVPRKGYRFLAPVERPEKVATEEPAPRPPRRWLFAAAAVMVVSLSALAVGTLVAARARSDVDSVAAAATLARRAPEPDAAGVMVVLPFQSYSATADDDYLGDGLTEELITEISRRYGGRLGVIARTSAMKYKQTTRSAGEIAADLGADYVLEGSVRRERDRLRITAQLIRAADEMHLWAGNYDRQLIDFIDLQSEVSAKIGQALALELQLEPASDPGIAATRPAVYDAYLRGRHALARRNASGFLPKDAVTSAREHLERATELDPGFAPAWVELSAVYRFAMPSREGAERARQALERALALDDASPRAHRALAQLRFYVDWDLEAASESFERALELDPGYAEAHHDFAAYHSVTGQHDQAVASVQRALRLDPLSPGVASDVGWYYYFGRRFEGAIEHSRRTLVLEPGFFWAKRCIILAATAAGDFDTAAAQALDDMRQIGASAGDLRAIENANPEAAVAAYWSWRLDRMLANAEERPPPPIELATIHIARGETSGALEALEQAYRQRQGWILPFLGVDPMFDPLRSEPRFRALVDSIAGRPTS